MKALQHFEEFLISGVVKKQARDLSRAKSLREEADTAYSFLVKIQKDIAKEEQDANSLIKISYDIIMDIIRAEMLENGFHATGEGAHQAEVSYARKMQFTETDVQFLNQLRYNRNGISYYGKRFDLNYAIQVISFLEKKLKEIYP